MANFLIRNAQIASEIIFNEVVCPRVYQPTILVPDVCVYMYFFVYPFLYFCISVDISLHFIHTAVDIGSIYYWYLM